ncbi:dTDP-4-dehydrorhamnose reductase [Streptomyces naganishii]|uniref:dTDP-4-dehydrorhamnose reductase n=1 Tax=Streptomyces naganishii TaxID=285447 RepID=UPI00367D405E
MIASRDFSPTTPLPAAEFRWLVVGAGGTLGRAVRARLEAADAVTVALGRGELDVTDRRAAFEAVAAHRPHTVVNCAAWTDVDGAEHDEAAATRVNADGPRHLALACAGSGARLVHVSTDYVFGGAPGHVGTPYAEDTPPEPRTAYGRTKLAGERAVLAALPHTAAVVRTSWLYGPAAPGPAAPGVTAPGTASGVTAPPVTGFVGTMARIAAEPDRAADVVDDQHGQPSWAPDVAERLVALGSLPAARASGVFHATGAGRTTWHELAQEVFRLLGADPLRVRPMGSDRLTRPARRPAWSVLGHSRWTRAGLPPMRHWRTALTEAIAPRTAPAHPTAAAPAPTTAVTATATATATEGR